MPSPHYRRVRRFMQKVGQPTPSSPEIPSGDIRTLRAKLILEEALETITALGIKVTAEKNGAAVDVTDPVSALRFDPDGEVDLEGVVDGCADISVVTVGTLIAFGVDDEPVLREVDDANLRKFGPGSYMREDGKWMKPPEWTPPDIEGVLKNQVRIEI